MYLHKLVIYDIVDYKILIKSYVFLKAINLFIYYYLLLNMVFVIQT